MKNVLRQANWNYVGVCRVPESVSGFSDGGMTTRMVGGKLRFMMTCHRYGPDVCEFELNKPVRDFKQATRPAMLNSWTAAQIFADKRRSWNPDGSVRVPSGWQTAAIAYRDPLLYWSFFDAYNVGGADDFCLGATNLTTGKVSGPWRTQAHSHKASGWLIWLPDGRLGLGAPLTSGNVSSSWGCNLFGLVPPTPDTPAGYGSPVLPVTTFLSHDFTHRQARNGDYVSRGVPDHVPADGIGAWTQIDMLGGACWIDMPDVHGLLFTGFLGNGEIFYGPNRGYDGKGFNDWCGGEITGPHAEKRTSTWWMYDPDTLGAGDPWAHVPTSVWNPTDGLGLQMGCTGQMTGSVFHAPTRTLYVACPGADPQTYLTSPVIHVWVDP